MKYLRQLTIVPAAALAAIATSASFAETLSTHRIPAALAAEAAGEAVAACAKQGYHETAVVLDADGATIASLRGDGAGIHTLDSAFDKAYTAVSFYTRYDIAYYAINDRAAGRRTIELDLMTPEQHADVPEDEDVTAADRLIIDSPTMTGLIVLRALAPEPGLMAMARHALAGAQCRVEPMPAQ